MRVRDLDCFLEDCVFCDLSNNGKYIETDLAIRNYSDYYVLQISADINVHNDEAYVLIDIAKTESASDEIIE